MTISPAQIANDLTAQAAYFAKSDSEVAATCRDGARMIRRLLAGEAVDGHSYRGVLDRFWRQEGRFLSQRDMQIAKSITRGRNALMELWGAR